MSVIFHNFKIKGMKKMIVFCTVLFFILSNTMAQPPKVSAAKGSLFGTMVNATDTVSTDKLPDLLKENKTAEVTIKGVIVEVCKAKGCFVYMKTATGKIYIKTKDDSFFVPLALKGKTVVVQGTAAADKKSKEVSIQATGILVM
jgi:hypothetical protein